MPFDFTDLSNYLSDETNPSEVIQTLRRSQYMIVEQLAEQSDSSCLADCYLSLLMLEDEFLKLEGLPNICMKWG